MSTPKKGNKRKRFSMVQVDESNISNYSNVFTMDDPVVSVASNNNYADYLKEHNVKVRNIVEPDNNNNKNKKEDEPIKQIQEDVVTLLNPLSSNKNDAKHINVSMQFILGNSSLPKHITNDIKSGKNLKFISTGLDEDDDKEEDEDEMPRKRRKKLTDNPHLTLENNINIHYNTVLSQLIEFAESLAGKLGKNDLKEVWNGPRMYENQILISPGTLKLFESKIRENVSNNMFELLRNNIESTRKIKTKKKTVKTEKQEEEEESRIKSDINIPYCKNIGIRTPGRVSLGKKILHKSKTLPRDFFKKQIIPKVNKKIEEFDVIVKDLTSQLNDGKIDKEKLKEESNDAFEDLKDSVIEIINIEEEKFQETPETLDPIQRGVLQTLTEQSRTLRNNNAFDTSMPIHSTVWNNVIYKHSFRHFTPRAKAGIENAIRDIHTICGRPDVVLFDVMTHEEVRIMFATLVAFHINVISIERPSVFSQLRRGPQQLQNLSLARRRFKAIRYNSEGKLVFTDFYNPVMTSIRKFRQNVSNRRSVIRGAASSSQFFPSLGANDSSIREFMV